MTDPAHILVVDDDDRIRDLLKRFLSREGHRVTTASDAAAARRLLATMTFDLAILDVMMPGEDGLRCAAILRRSHKDAPPEEVEMSGLVFNAARGELREGDKRIRLTDAELQLLTVLAANAGEPVDREDLAALTSAGMERSVDVQVTRLRRKIEPNPREPIHIQTVRGVGYRLMPD